MRIISLLGLKSSNQQKLFTFDLRAQVRLSLINSLFFRVWVHLGTSKLKIKIPRLLLVENWLCNVRSWPLCEWYDTYRISTILKLINNKDSAFCGWPFSRIADIADVLFDIYTQQNNSRSVKTWSRHRKIFSMFWMNSSLPSKKPSRCYKAPAFLGEFATASDLEEKANLANVNCFSRV